MSLRAIKIEPAKYDDIPVLAGISSDSFEGDTQTEMKQHGRAPFDMREYSLTSLPGSLKSPRLRIIKAVEESTGDIMGYCIWGFRGVEPPVFPPVDFGTDDATGPTEQTKTKEQEKDKTDDSTDPIARLEKLTGTDFNNWVDELMADGSPCLFIVGLYVAPSFQRRGAGTALLKWGTDLADANGAFAWVHSSAGAWRAYEKAGFRTVRTLTVNLDNYAPVPAPETYPDGRWGDYTFRYMVYGKHPGTT
ncbi:acyl-CoA N-acyltransferase [Echria macrotheca]|uniref:Acyl-CoA N-acyltransferase n=1 Tax=Echria macrotheca TaxID=438768 RepID=A0AAJ0B6P4_9PEZI|nr:acyl-CoA N-acyltransferase [Echria macrotheca]